MCPGTNQHRVTARLPDFASVWEQANTDYVPHRFTCQVFHARRNLEPVLSLRRTVRRSPLSIVKASGIKDVRTPIDTVQALLAHGSVYVTSSGHCTWLASLSMSQISVPKINQQDRTFTGESSGPSGSISPLTLFSAVKSFCT